MRFTLRIACLALSATGLCVSPSAAQFCGVTVDCDWPVPDVAHWTFNDVSQTNGLNGNAEDVINGNTAIWQGPVGNNVPVGGLIGGALQQNDEDGGSQEHYAMDLPQLIGAGGYSVSIWFNQNVANNNNNVQTGLFGNRGVDFDLVNPDTMEVTTVSSFTLFNIEGNNTPRGFDARFTNFNGRVDAAEPGTRIGAGETTPSGGTFDGIIGNVVDEWHHAVFTFDNTTGTQSLYFDGVLIGDATQEANIGATISGTTQTWHIGEDSGNREFSGTLDDTGVWTTALSATDVAQIYAAGLVGVDLSKVEPPQPGDVDLDDDVDLTDFAAIQTNFFTETGATRADGDLTGGGAVDWADFREWKDNFPFPTASSNAVPEPTSVMIACLAVLSLGACRKRA